jgi:vacuolar-type H+-ATPase subunit C/Vma6
VTRPAAYSQILVKAGAERSYIIRPEQIKVLATCRNLEEFVASLSKSPYEGLLKNVENLTAEKLQHVFKEELIRVCSKIVCFSPKEIQDFLRVYLSWLEIENLKGILKAKSAKIPYETIINRLHLTIEEVFGRKNLFIQAAEAEDVKDLIETFRETIYSPILSEAMLKYEETGSTKFFDFALDRAYYDNLLDSAETLPPKDSEISFSSLGPNIDKFNILTVIRSKLLGYPSHLTYRVITHKLYELSENNIKALISSENVNSALDLVSHSFYGKFLSRRETIEETLVIFENSIENFVFRRLYKTRLVDPFNIATPLSVVMLKEKETQNLITISSGIEYGWKPESIVSFFTGSYSS